MGGILGLVEEASSVDIVSYLTYFNYIWGYSILEIFIYLLY